MATIEEMRQSIKGHPTGKMVIDAVKLFVPADICEVTPPTGSVRFNELNQAVRLLKDSIYDIARNRPGARAFFKTDDFDSTH